MKNLQNELPQEILEQLDPKLVKLYSQLPSEVSSRVANLVRRAVQLPIHPNRLIKYAYLYATAEQQAQGDAVSREHATRSRVELAGGIHGLETGYWENAEARKQYRQGRKARQQIEASLQGLLKNWERFERVVQGHRSELPLHLQGKFSDKELAAIREQLISMRRSMVLGRDVLSENDRSPELTVVQQTFLWWHHALARYYRGKWDHMHRLANTWKLSGARDVQTFRVMVVQICSGQESMRYPFGSSWKSVLSEKP